MKTIFHKYPILLFLSLAFAGCDTSDTKFFEDSHNRGLSIFSTTANNIATAYFGSQTWKTRDRIYNILEPTSYEIHIQKLVTNTASDTLVIRWRGMINGQDNYLPISLNYFIAVPKNFNAASFNSFKGQRITADGMISYFTVDGASFLPKGKGNGTIYFHTSSLMSNSTVGGYGRLSGLFEVAIGDYKITKGRFDHSLSPMHVSL